MNLPLDYPSEYTEKTEFDYRKHRELDGICCRASSQIESLAEKEKLVHAAAVHGRHV